MNRRIEELQKKLKMIARDGAKGGVIPEGTADRLNFTDTVFQSKFLNVTLCRMLFDEKGQPEDYSLEEVSPAFITLFGAKPEIGSMGGEFFGGVEGSPSGIRKEPLFLNFFATLLADGRTGCRTIFLEKYGKTFDILAIPRSPDEFYVLFNDATDRMAMEKERRENIKFVENILEKVDVWIVLLDENERVVFWNSMAERLSGITAEEAIATGIDFWEKCYPEDYYRAEIYKKIVAAASEGASSPPMEAVVLSARGERLIIEWTAARWPFEDIGTEGLLLLGRDVTKQRRTEEEFKQSKMHYVAACQGTNVVKLLIDGESGAIVDCNEAALSFYGYSREEMLSLKDVDINILPPDELRRKMDNVLHRRKHCFVFHHRLKNGEVRVVEVYCSPISYKGVALLHSIVHDITGCRNLKSYPKPLSGD